MASISRKSSRKDSFTVFDESQVEEAPKNVKKTVHVGVQADISLVGRGENTDVSVDPREGAAPVCSETLIYKQLAQKSKERLQFASQIEEEIIERTEADREQIRQLRDEYAALFASLADKLEDRPQEDA